MGGTVDLTEIENFLEKISKRYGIKKAIIFGSAARGEFKEDSDIDLIIVSGEFKGKSALKRPVQLYLEWDLNYPVDFICYTTEEFENLKNRPSIVREALREGVVVEF
ncbi:nucleotidyltransferase family protein [Methermicoccus shengliensis]|uniref:Nucleotidyltransferase domain-containing protein n=1 Tax=Methermicoccus shengliensis TaxID=660064 RepID=A0A832VMZ4_9EURY|nr:nucleotidyltransferase domain-containing protein [Methermicoccus shengliensis]HIH69796.1 nucleotidyltransferase domain-containing protein [Methermicoccus shengliensis]